MKFDLLFRNNTLQIFKSSSNNLFKKKFLFVYRQYKIEDNIKSFEVKRYESNHLPLILMASHKGFLFVKDKVKSSELDIILNGQSSIKEIPKTLFIDLNNIFQDNKYNIAYALISTSGKTTSAFIYKTDNKKNIKKSLKNYIKRQNETGPKTAKKWFEFVINNAPEIYYDSIKNNIQPMTKKDISIFYDLRVKNEMEVIKEIEDIFIDKNKLVTIYNDYSGLYKRIIENKLKIKKLENDYLIIKYKDLIKGGLDFNLLDYL